MAWVIQQVLNFPKTRGNIDAVPHNALYTDNGWRFTIAIVIAHSSRNGQYVTSLYLCIHTALITPSLTAAIMVLPMEPFIEKFILKFAPRSSYKTTMGLFTEVFTC